MLFRPVFRRSSWLWALAAGLAIRAAAEPADGTLHPEAGRSYIQHFTPRDFEGHNQVFDLAQDRDGVMYLTNRGALLEYDGVAWRRASVPTTWIRKLHLAADGRVYLAGTDELGYVDHDASGTPVYHSLLPHLPPELRQVGAVWAVDGHRGAVYFATSTHVFRWRDNAFKVWPMPAASRANFFLVRNRLYQHRGGDGLYELSDDGEQFTAINREPAIAQNSRITMLDDPAGDPVILTIDGQCFHFRDHRLAPWAAPAAAWLREAGAVFGLRLKDGRMAVSTLSRGLALLSRSGELQQVFDPTNGLDTPQLYKLIEDREGSLWLGHFSGASRIELNAGYTLFDTLSGKGPGNLADVVRHGSDHYTYSIDSVYRIKPSAPGSGRPAGLERLDLPVNNLWAMSPHRDGPIIGGQAGLQQLVAGRLQPIHVFRDAVMAFSPAPGDPDEFLVGLVGGLSLLRKEAGVWRDLGVVAGITAEIRSILADGPDTVWLGTTTRGFIRLRRASPAQSWQTAAVTEYHGTRGVPADAGWCNVLQTPAGPTFLTARGILRYDAATDTFAPDPRWAINGRGDLEIAPFTSSEQGSVWLQANTPGRPGDFLLGRFVFPTPESAPTWESFPRKLLQRAGYDGAKAMTREDTPEGEVVWLGGTDSLVRIEPARVPRVPLRDWRALVRSVWLTGRGGWNPEQTGVRMPSTPEPLRIAYAAPLFAASGPLTYQHRLRGFADNWSDWSTRTQVEYTNLPGGAFTFEVRARDGDGNLSEPARFAFAVTPPWHLSAGAFAAYLAMLIVTVFAFIRWRLRAIERERARLEQLVADRTAELAVAHDEAQAANRAKSTFLAHMSHELRTPLNGIIGYAQVLKRDPAVAGLQRERVDLVHRSGEHLLRLINEVLDFSKIEAGRVERHDAPFAPVALLRELAALHGPAASAKGLVLTLDLPASEGLRATGDAQKLRQVLDNLLGNAVKFTRSGSVTLAAAPAAADAWHFAVRDTGVGLSAEELARLFQPFAQAANRPDAGGTGLGLVITQRLVRLLGGELQVESTPGRGSEFHFTLPLPPAPGSVAPFAPAGEITGYAGPRRRIFIVDDHEVNRRLVTDLLAPLGFECAAAASAEEALAQPALATADLVISDVRLPGIDGLEFARRLRAQRAVPVILSSASVLIFDHAAARAAGVPDFLPKPFAAAQLHELLGRLLGLDWQRAAPATPAAQGADLPGHIRRQLADLADSGDIAAFRTVVRGLRTTLPDCLVTLDELDNLAAGYQLERLRQALRENPA